MTCMVSDTTPVTVIYSITEYGKTTQDIMYSLYEWGTKHREKIKEEN